MSKPLLFLDVDGVLNVFSTSSSVACDPIQREDKYGILTAFVPRGTRERIARLLEEFEIVWATAWVGTAHGFFREHLSLPDTSWPFLSYVGYKIPEIVKYANGRPFAFVDDDIEFERSGLHKAFFEQDDSLILDINPKEGLTDKDVTALLVFAKTLKG